MKKISKKEAQNEIDNFFPEIKNKNPQEIKKIQNLSKSYNIKLGTKKKAFCKKCLSPYKSPKIRIHKGIKSVECENCGYKSRWKIKPS